MCHTSLASSNKKYNPNYRHPRPLLEKRKTWAMHAIAGHYTTLQKKNNNKITRPKIMHCAHVQASIGIRCTNTMQKHHSLTSLSLAQALAKLLLMLNSLIFRIHCKLGRSQYRLHQAIFPSSTNPGSIVLPSKLLRLRCCHCNSKSRDRPTNRNSSS